MKPVKVVFPYPPTVNHYWGMKGRIRFLTVKARKFREEVINAVKFYKLDNNYDGPIGIYMWTTAPDKRKRDIDNVIKPMLDALEHADVYTNDCNIEQIHRFKLPYMGKNKSVTVVGIYPLEVNWWEGEWKKIKSLVESQPE